MKFGISVMPVDAPDQFVELVREVEAAGFDSMLVCDSSLHSRDTFAYMTLAAINTSRVVIGTNILNPLTRHPGLSVRGVATLDEISHGRVLMGIGRGSDPLAELGLKQATMQHIRDMVTTTRELLRGDHVTFESPAFSFSNAQLRFKNRSEIPIYIAGTGPKMLEVAGEIADGAWMHVGPDPRCVAAALESVMTGARRAGRPASSVTASSFLFSRLDEDRNKALDTARLGATYLLTANPTYARLIGLPEPQIAALKAAYSGTHFHEATEAARMTSDEMADTMTLSGNVDDIIRKLERIAELGIDHVDLFPMGDDHLGQVRAFGKHIIHRFK